MDVNYFRNGISPRILADTECDRKKKCCYCFEASNLLMNVKTKKDKNIYFEESKI